MAQRSPKTMCPAQSVISFSLSVYFSFVHATVFAYDWLCWKFLGCGFFAFVRSSSCLTIVLTRFSVSFLECLCDVGTRHQLLLNRFVCSLVHEKKTTFSARSKVRGTLEIYHAYIRNSDSSRGDGDWEIVDNNTTPVSVSVYLIATRPRRAWRNLHERTFPSYRVLSPAHCGSAVGDKSILICVSFVDRS
jgi:hypothetical protein